MADIYEPEPTPRAMYQHQSEKKPLFATLVTMIVGIGALGGGLIYVLIGNITLFYDYSMYLLFIGSGNSILGLIDIYVGLKIWNWNYDVRYLGVIANIGLLILNIVSFVIGIITFVLVIISIIALMMLDTSS